jgi:hypothetical protein
MFVHCPACGQKIRVGAVKPGAHRAMCVTCGQVFILNVAEDRTLSVTSALVPPSAAGLAAVAERPVAPPPATAARRGSGTARKPPLRPVPDATADHETEGAGDPDATAEHEVAQVRRSAKPQRRGTGVTARREAGDAEEPPDVPAVLGNYDIVKRLGRGGMGAVYLARQRSLDRAVALKVMHPRWAEDPRFLVRFTREAYAAAQLTHPNVVQVYDLGADQGVNWFSMEFVDGTSLGGLLSEKGPLTSRLAAGYVLQAARGLQFAHERGMVHRDVKPDNLMLSKQGVVKVADLGLVRTPGATDPESRAAGAGRAGQLASEGTLASLAGVTVANQAMGTPFYMAPEQVRDAAGVDERADIYSLGCTLYALVTDHPVFTGRTAEQVMAKHLHEPVTPPEVHTPELPRALSRIILRALEKKPEDRYQTTEQFVAALEAFLGVGGAGGAVLGPEHAETLEAGARAFLGVPEARWRRLVFPAGVLLCALLFLGCLALGTWRGAGGVVGLAVLTPLAYFIVGGVYHPSFLFRKTREWVLDNTWLEWLQTACALILFLAILYFTGLLLSWIVVCTAAVLFAFAIELLLDRPLAARRRAALADVRKMLKLLRLRGVSEEALQEFVCRYAGEHWEELFEELFGYEAKLAARARWGADSSGTRPKFGAWRDAVVRWIEARQQARREARERKHLQAVEQNNLVAQGLTPAQARRQAELVAEAMVEKAAKLKHDAEAPATGFDGGPRRRPDLRALYAAAMEPAPRRRRGRTFGGLIDRLLGPNLRMLIGAALVCAALAWLHGTGAAEVVGNGSPYDTKTWQRAWDQVVESDPVQVPFVDDGALPPISCLAAGLAGLLLMASAFQALRWLSLVHYGCAVVMIGGPQLGVSALGPLDPPLASLAIGGGISLLALLGAPRRRS